MKTFQLRRFFFTLVLLLIPSWVWGACTWQWDCSNGYPCKQIPVCARPYEPPPPMLPGVSPLPPAAIPTPPTVPIQPTEGAKSCSQVYICKSDGTCAYQTVCK